MGQRTKNCTLFHFFYFQVTVNINNTILLSKKWLFDIFFIFLFSKYNVKNEAIR